MERDGLFDSGSSPYGGDDIHGTYAHLRARLLERGIPVHTGDMLTSGGVAPAELNVYATLGIRSRYRALADRSDTVVSALFVNECPVVEPRLFDALHEAKPYFRRFYSFAGDEAMLPYVREPMSFLPFRFPYPFDEVDSDAWSRGDRGFITIINANKRPRSTSSELYSERLRAIEFFEKHGEIDLFGIGWDGPPFRIGETRIPRSVQRLAYLAERRWDRARPLANKQLAAARRAWRGAIASKSQTLSGYTFAICFENMTLEGWVTEKVFDCLRAGAIPIYLGAPDIERWLDRECFIDMRRFSGYPELRTFLHSLGPREIEAYREAGREFFGSDRFRPFSKDAFVDIVEQILAEDAGVRL